MIEPLNELTNQLTQIQQSLIAGERIFNLLDTERTIRSIPTACSGKYQFPEGKLFATRRMVNWFGRTSI